MKLKLNQYKPISKSDYLLVAWLILLSGSPLVHVIPGSTYITGICGIIYVIIRRKYSFFLKISPSILFFLIIYLAQYLTLGYLPIKYPLGLFIMIVAGAFIYYKLGVKFNTTYFNVIAFFSSISLVFWLLQIVFGVTFDLLNQPNLKNIIIWNVRNDPYSQYLLETRNSGPVWEPGAFAGYILLAGILNINNLKFLWEKHKIKSIVTVLALITTVSTTGYIISFLFILYKAFNLSFKHLIILPPVILVIYLSIIKLDFIGEKILVQYESAIAMEGNSFANTRTGSLLFDLNYIEKHPLVGNGVDPKTRWADHQELYLQSINGKNLGHGNGFSGFMASMGILSLLFIIINLIFSLKKYLCLKDTVFIVFVFLLLLQGESYLNYPLLFCLYFI